MKLNSLKISIIIFVIFAVIVFLDSCKKDKYVEPLCFDTDVLPILNNKCAMSGCHNSIDKKEGWDLSSYDAIQAHSEKEEIMEQINKGKMPPSGNLTVSEKKILARWAASGYGRGECGSNSTSCDTTNVTYTNSIKTIFDTYCTGCHNASNPSSGFALDTYSGAVNCANSGRLLGAVQWMSGYSAMPQGGSKLSDCNIAKIQKWINSGKPN
jgi:cytochrome c5